MSAKVYATVPGAAYAIGEYGIATTTTPAIVPDDVATQIEEEIRGERPNPNFGVEGHPDRDLRMLKIGRGPSTHLRVEREIAPSPTRPAPARPTPQPKDEEK